MSMLDWVREVVQQPAQAASWAELDAAARSDSRDFGPIGTNAGPITPPAQGDGKGQRKQHAKKGQEGPGDAAGEDEDEDEEGEHAEVSLLVKQLESESGQRSFLWRWRRRLVQLSVHLLLMGLLGALIGSSLMSSAAPPPPRRQRPPLRLISDPPRPLPASTPPMAPPASPVELAATPYSGDEHKTPASVDISTKEQGQQQQQAAPASRTKVCVQMQRVNPRHASMFLRNYLQQFGGRAEYVLGKEVWQALRYVRKSGSLDASEFEDAQEQRCGADWPVLYLNFQGKHVKKDLAATQMVVGDEKCRCARSVCADASVTPLRQYWSSQYGPGSQWVPLGPRFEFAPVPEALRARDPLERAYSFTFMGSNNAPGRNLVRKLSADAKLARVYPAMSRSYVHMTSGWNPDPGAHGGVKPLAYRDVMLNSTFALAISGSSYDTYRMWEAVESGSIPVIEVGVEYQRRSPCKDTFAPLLAANAPFLVLRDWRDLPKAMEKAFADPAALRRQHKELLEWRVAFFANASRTIECAIAAKQPKKAAALAEGCA